MVDLPTKTLRAHNPRIVGHREAAAGHYAEAGADAIPAIGGDLPDVFSFIERGCRDARLEPDQLADPEAIRDIAGVIEDLALGGVFLRPAPLAPQFGGPGVGVIEARNVAAHARIAIPVPGTANLGRGFEADDRQSEFAKPVPRIEATEPGADDDGIILA